VSIDPATGNAFVGLVVEDSGIRIYDTPAVVYIPGEAAFRMAYAVDSAAIYSYRRPATGGPWSGTGDIFNDTTANVSSPVLTVVPDQERRSFVHAWFVRYW
jgi:hypothetical protein